MRFIAGLSWNYWRISKNLLFETLEFMAAMQRDFVKNMKLYFE